MQTLKDHTLIYDADCPLCRAYSKTFIACGMMEKEGRAPYNSCSTIAFPVMDKDRARNEIALVNRKTHTVTYGLDSLLVIIGHSFPLLAKIAALPPFYRIFRSLYSFVSYNRKVIIPVRKKERDPGCTPDFSRKYRLAYIIFVLLLSTFALAAFAGKLISTIPSLHNAYIVHLICTGQIIWQFIFFKIMLRKDFMEYCGNMMTVSLIGTLLLLPLLCIPGTPVFALYYFMAVVGIMFFEHLRRCNLLQLGLLPSLSWLVFRVAAAGILLAA